MKRIYDLKAERKTYIHPVVTDIVKQVMRGLGGRPTLTYTLENFAIKGEPLVERDAVTFTITEKRSDMNNMAASSGMFSGSPLFINDTLDLEVFPRYNSVELSISVVVATISRTDIGIITSRLSDISVESPDHIFTAVGNYKVPQRLIDMFKNMNAIVNSKLNTDVTDEDFISGLGTDRLRLATNLSGLSDAIVVEERQTNIMMSLEKNPDISPLFDRDTKMYSLEFSFTISMQVPKRIEVEFQPLIMNEFLNDEFLPRNTVSEKIEDYNYFKEVLETMSTHGSTWDSPIDGGVVREGLFAGLSVNANEGETISEFYARTGTGTTFNNGIAIPGSVFSGFDLGYEYNGRLEKMPTVSNIIDLSWEAVDGKILNGPFSGFQMLNEYTGFIQEGFILNHSVYGGMLDALTSAGKVGGYVISYMGKSRVIGGRLHGSVVESIRRATPYPLEGDINNLGIITSGFLLGKKIASRNSTIHSDPYLHNLGLMGVVNANNSYTNSGYGFINIPFFDTFNPVISDKYSKLLSVLIQKDIDSPRTLMSLHDLGAYRLDERVLDMIRNHSDGTDIFQENQFFLNMKLYDSVGGLVSPAKLSIDVDTMVISMDEDLENTRTYRLVISILLDYTTMYDTNIKDIIAEFNKAYGILYLKDGILTPTRMVELTAGEATNGNHIIQLGITMATMYNKPFIKDLLWR